MREKGKNLKTSSSNTSPFFLVAYENDVRSYYFNSICYSDIFQAINTLLDV